MKSILIVLTLICSVLMFFVKKEYKLSILFMSTMILSMLSLPKGIHACEALSVAFVISELQNIRLHVKRISASVLLPYIVLVIVSFVISVITSPNLHSVKSLGYFVLDEILTRQLAIIYGFLALRKSSSLKPLVWVSFVALVIMTLAGYFNWVTGESTFVEELFEGTLTEYDFITTERFRVQATFVNPFDYGYMCVLLAVFNAYAYFQKMESLPLLIAAQLCCLFGVITCNCRTILFCYLVSAAVFSIAIQKSKKTKLMFFIGGLLLAIFLISVVPSARKTFLSLISIFDPTSVTKGSSLAMRLVQLSTVLYYISGNLLFGRGVHFFNLDLGWSDGSALAADSDLYGLEGIYLNLLLERGFVGFALYLAMMVLLIVFVCRHRKMGRKLYALGLTVLILYILFGFMTGELLSTAPTYYILGYVIAEQTRRSRIIAKLKRCRA